MRIIGSVVKYIFILYLFDVLDVNILLYKCGQSQTILTQGKEKYLAFRMGVGCSMMVRRSVVVSSASIMVYLLKHNKVLFVLCYCYFRILSLPHFSC